MKLYQLYSLIFLFINLTVFGQHQEDKIYNAVDVFVAHPSAKALQNLTIAESDFWKNPRPKTKDELLAIVVLNCNKAYYENLFGQTQNAISSYEKAWQLYQKNKLSNYDIIEFCLKPLGNLYTVLGDYDSAENIIKQYFFIANLEKNEAQKVAAILNLSNVYQNTGRVIEGIELLEKTLKTEKLSNSQKGILLNNLGNNYLLFKGNLMTQELYKKAENAFKSAVNYLENDNDHLENLSNSYRNLANVSRQTHRFKIADFYLEKATELFLKIPNQQPRKIAKLYYEKALLLFDEKKYAESTKQTTAAFKILIPSYVAKNILPTENELYAETVLMDVLDLQASIFANQNQFKKALEGYKLSFHIENLLMSGLVYENSKIISQIRARTRTEKCLLIYDRLYKKENRIEYLEEAFQLAEKTKSGILKSHLSNSKTASAEEKQLLQEFQNANNSILKEQQKGNLANISVINSAIKNQNELMLSLKKIQSENPSSIPENFDLKALFSKLEKDKAIMVYYFMGAEYLYYFTIQNSQISLNHFDVTDNANSKILRFTDYFRTADAITNDIVGYNYYGKSTYDLLKLPSNQNYKNLIIVPDGILNFLPFEALITKESSTTNFAKMHYLLNDFKIAYNTSATIYLNAKPVSKSKKTVLGVFPVFENTAFELSYSKKEMESIKSYFKGKYLENADASFANFKNNASKFSILHLSTHASSGDIETPASIKFYDQEILYSELYNLHINPDLVVLSACETGIGKLYKAEGAMSVARGFQFAGAQNLLFSLWKVNDFTTSVFMEDFYKNSNNNVSYFEANSKAKLDYLNNKSISNVKKSPYYWSSFVYYGSISAEEKSVNYIYYIVSLLILIGLFLIFNQNEKWKIFTNISKKRNTKK